MLLQPILLLALIPTFALANTFTAYADLVKRQDTTVDSSPDAGNDLACVMEKCQGYMTTITNCSRSSNSTSEPLVNMGKCLCEAKDFTAQYSTCFKGCPGGSLTTTIPPPEELEKSCQMLKEGKLPPALAGTAASNTPTPESNQQRPTQTSANSANSAPVASGSPTAVPGKSQASGAETRRGAGMVAVVVLLGTLLIMV
ncbi:uncharacterized protein VTP21DRAFT_10760 [Calcarisporiella thermophila]|uniref:uncharacterized protein n=1 Tax=Calcarisporiella thermophila TaxID=911321 RepID=UPI003742A346